MALTNNLDNVKLRAQWLANNIALKFRGLNPLSALSGQPFMQLGDPTKPMQDAIVEVYEPVTSARYPAVPGTAPTGSVKKIETQVKMYHVDDGIPMSHTDIDQCITSGEVPQIIGLVADGILEKLQTLAIPDVIKGTFQYSGAVNALPVLAADVIAAKAALEARTQGMHTPPGNGRALWMTQEFNNGLLGVSEYVIASSVGDAATMATGKLTPKMGFSNMLDTSYLSGVNVTTGTATGVIASGAHLAGATLLSIITAAGAGTVKIGSVFTIAGSTQRHVVRGKITTAPGGGGNFAGRMTYADITLVNGAAQECLIYPPLPANVADTTALTFVATHGIAALAFNPLALVCVARRFPDYQPGTGWVGAYAVDSETKMAFRVHTYGDYMVNGFAVDVCGGMACASPRWMSRVVQTPA